MVSRIGRIVLVALALAALALVVGLALLGTRWGGDVVRDRVVPRLDQAVEGRLSVGSLRIRPGRLRLEHVVLRAPDGTLVAQIPRLTVDFSPWALLGGRVDIARVIVESPRLWLTQDERGLNLARALSSRQEDERAGDRPAVRVRALEVRGGVVDLRLRGGRRVRLEELALDGSARLGGDEWEATLRSRAALRAPLAAPLLAAVTARGDAGGLHATGRAALGDSAAAFAVRHRAGELAVQIDEAAIAPDLVRRAARAYRGPAVRVAGRLSWRAPELAADLRLRAGTARVWLEGRLDTRRLRSPGLQVRGRDIDLGALLAGAPRTRLALTVDGEGGGRSLDEADGRLRLALAPARVGGRRLGPLVLHARARGGRVRISTTATAPGLRLEAAGVLTARRVNARGTVALTDLGAAAAALDGAADLAGHGRAWFRLDGPLAAPSLSVEARLGRIAAGAQAARGVTLSAHLPRADRPERLSLRLDARRIAAADRTAGPLSVRARTGADRRFALALRLGAPRTAVEAAGVWARDGRALRLDHLVLDLPAGRWRLARPARLARRGDGLAIEGLALASGSQRIALDLRGSRRRLALTVEAHAVALASVPGLHLRGILDGRLALSTRPAAPHLALDAAVRGLAVRGQRLGDLVIMVRDEPGAPARATVQLRGDGHGGQATLTTPLDLVAVLRGDRPPPDPLAVPFAFQADVRRVPIGTVARLFPRAPLTGGALDLRAELTGPLRAPTGTLSARGTGLAGPRLPPTEAVLSVEAHQKTRLVLALQRRGVRLLALEGTLDLPGARLGDRAALAAAALDVTVRAGPLRFQRAGVLPASPRAAPRTLRGRAVASARVTGSPARPRAVVRAEADGLSLDRTPLGRATFTGRYEDRLASATLDASTPGGGTLRLAGRAPVDLSLDALARGIDVRALPLALALDARAFDLRVLTGVTPRVQLVGGRLDGRARFAGTLAHPAVQGRLAWRGGTLALAGLGVYRDIHLDLRGDEREIVLEELRARSRGGTARVQARAVRRADAPWHLTAAAHLREFPVYAEGQPAAAVGLDAEIAAEASRAGVRATARVDEAHLRLLDRRTGNVQDLTPPPDVVIVRHGVPIDREQAARLRALQARRAGRAPAAPSRAAAPVPIRLAVEAPRNLWVRGADTNLELGLDPGFVVGITDETRVFGRVVARRGHTEVLGRRFDVQPGSALVFTGPVDRPELAVTAVHEARKMDITIVVEIEGPLDGPRLAIHSPERPQLGDAELVSVLVTGRLPGDRVGAVPSPAAAAASIVGGVVAARLQALLSRRLPLDVVAIEPGEGLGSTRIEAGAYVARDLYVAYVGRVGADPFRRENRNEVHLEYQLTRRWSFEASYGDARRGSADLVWSRHF